MLQIRQFFNTRKRALTSSAVAVAILALAGTGTAFATETVARNTSIGSGNAQNFAFADAGVDPTSATGIRTEFDFEQGQFIYEVEFLANGTEYEYWIKASDGSIVKKEQDLIDPTISSAPSGFHIFPDPTKAHPLHQTCRSPDCHSQMNFHSQKNSPSCHCPSRFLLIFRPQFPSSQPESQ